MFTIVRCVSWGLDINWVSDVVALTGDGEPGAAGNWVVVKVVCGGECRCDVTGSCQFDVVCL